MQNDVILSVTINKKYFSSNVCLVQRTSRKTRFSREVIELITLHICYVKELQITRLMTGSFLLFVLHCEARIDYKVSNFNL